MHAIVVEQPGNSAVLQWKQIASLSPGPGQVRVRVHYAGVNFVDIYHRSGIYPMPMPGSPGMEGSGTVLEVGEGVRNLHPGDQVLWLNLGVGGYAEEALLQADRVLPLPEGLNLREGAALPLQGLTAHYLMHEYAAVKPGTKVLIHAAAGGMGLLLTQWARHLGAEVFGTVSTEDKAKVAKEAGAHHTILYTEQDFVEQVLQITGGSGVDYIIDGVGKDTFEKGQSALRTHGWQVIYGYVSGAPGGFTTAGLERGLRLGAGNLFTYVADAAEYRRRFAEVLKGVREGWLRLHYGPQLPLARAAEAHDLLASRQTTGKLLLQAVE